MLLYTRVADVGDGLELYGGISVIRVHELDTFLDLLDRDPDAEDLIGYLLARLGPPALVTAEGDPLELCTATFTTTAPVKLARELDQLFASDNHGTWLVAADTDGGGGQADVVRALASLELTGRTLTLQRCHVPAWPASSISSTGSTPNSPRPISRSPIPDG